MRITHIYHSGFSVECETCSLLFDWYTGTLPDLSHDKPLFVFVSHIHYDHYSSAIWNLGEKFASVTYLVDDAVAADAPSGLDVVAVRPNERYNAGELGVRTFESNDEGVAFLVSVPEATIFFSGDLNVWWWDRPEDENRTSERFFRRQVSKIGEKVDVAFLPVDPRLVDPLAGLVAFEEECGASLVVPMHYWDSQDEVRDLVDKDKRVAAWRDAIDFDNVINFEP
jgi:L-ascorbate metabolism protein UlaG (beta-lactamase superfamily)